MLGYSSEVPQSDIDIWLSTLGFQPGRHPFLYTNADDERDLIPRSFVDVDGYEVIKSSQTIIVFAPKGGGKSALRVVLANQAAPISPEKENLAVECVDFDLLLYRQSEAPSLKVIDHLLWLLHAGIKSLLDALCPNQKVSIDVRTSINNIQAERAGKMTPPSRSRFAYFIRKFHPALLSAESLYDRFYWLDPTFKPNWDGFIDNWQNKCLNKLLQNTPLQSNASARLLADLNDFPEVPDNLLISVKEQMQTYVGLVKAAGFTAVHFLIDRLDETQETSSNPQIQADILEPLLTQLTLLETPGTAFKFFLSKETRDSLLDRPKIRRDRLTDHAVTIIWTRKQLKALLDARLTTYSDGQIQELSQLCRKIKIKVSSNEEPWLDEWIEEEMLQQAQGSPRRMLMSGQLLFQAHLNRLGPVGLLEKEDWETGKSMLIQKLLAPLKIFQDSSVIFLGQREVKLTTQEHLFILQLALSGGRCDRDTLAEQVWGQIGGISDDPLHKIVNRIRKKLNDDAKNPIYLITERGKGYLLKHFILT